MEVEKVNEDDKGMEVENENENDKGMEVENENEDDKGMEVEKATETDPTLRIIPDFPTEELEEIDKARIERNILRLEAEKENLKRNVNLNAISE